MRDMCVIMGKGPGAESKAAEIMRDPYHCCGNE
jgi:hypothetical protein